MHLRSCNVHLIDVLLEDQATEQMGHFFSWGVSISFFLGGHGGHSDEDVHKKQIVQMLKVLQILTIVAIHFTFTCLQKVCIISCMNQQKQNWWFGVGGQGHVFLVGL